ncbi:MAG: hypothetical protein EOO19_02495 [Chryseobacterium sp.]|nr:MAG: hypothetical protein EOO19_02495 [Chryseobacterium sp.]
MIVGNGLIANSLKPIDSEKILFFASGVSNSSETRDSEFEREFSLLKNAVDHHQECQLVYFSTLSVNDQTKQNSLYVLHKLKIENFIKNNCKKYTILRIGNVVGKGGNPNTLFNFLTEQISDKKKFNLHTKARRLLIDIDDIAGYLKFYQNPIQNTIINFSFPYYYSLKEIISEIEINMSTEADYEEVAEGDFYEIDFDDSIQNYFLSISPENYLKRLTKKYI